jgi:hypothetical protein
VKITERQGVETPHAQSFRWNFDFMVERAADKGRGFESAGYRACSGALTKVCARVSATILPRRVR